MPIDNIYILTINSHGQFEGIFSTPELAMRSVYLMCLYTMARGYIPVENMPKQILWRWNGGKRWETDVAHPSGNVLHFEIRGGTGIDNAWGGPDYLVEFAEQNGLPTFEAVNEIMQIVNDREANHVETL